MLLDSVLAPASAPQATNVVPPARWLAHIQRGGRAPPLARTRRGGLDPGARSSVAGVGVARAQPPAMQAHDGTASP